MDGPGAELLGDRGRPAAAGLGAAAPGGRPHRPHRRAGRRGPGAGAAWPWAGAGALRHFAPAGGGGGELCTHSAQRRSSAAGPGAGLPAARPAGLRRYDFPGGGGGDDPAWPALGGLLRQGRVHGGQRRAHGGGGGAGGYGGAAHHAPQRQGPHPGLWPGGKAHRPPDGGLGGEGHGLGPVL